MAAAKPPFACALLRKCIEIAGERLREEPARSAIFLNNAQANGGFAAAIGVDNGSPDIERNLFMGNTCDGQSLSGVVVSSTRRRPSLQTTSFGTILPRHRHHNPAGQFTRHHQ